MFRIAFFISLFMLILIGCSQPYIDTQGNLELINNHLYVEEIKVGMSEREAIQLLGSGEYHHGFGGHFRKYEDKGINIGISGDSDNDLYGKISYLEIRNPDFIIFSVRTGEKKNEGIDKLKEYGFISVNYSEDTFVKGEFSIALRGEGKIEYIQIFFDDKDLKDRTY